MDNKETGFVVFWVGVLLLSISLGGLISWWLTPIIPSIILILAAFTLYKD